MFRTICIGFVLRIFAAIWNGLSGSSLGGGKDAVSFHLVAVNYSKNLFLEEFRIGWIYSYVLGIFYSITTPSLLLGSLLSCCAWLISAFTLIKIMRLLLLDKKSQIRAMMVYAFLPSSILMTSVTLREPYQILFVNFAVYSALKIYKNKRFIDWIFLVFSCIGMGVLHGALFAFGLFLVSATFILLGLGKRKKLSFSKLAVAVPFVILTLVFGLSLFGDVSYNINDGLGAGVESYQQGLLSVDARTHYKSNVEINGGVGLLFFMPVSLFQYLFEPMPWRISAVLDVELMFENILRAILIWKAWVGLRNMNVYARRPVLFVFISYFVIEAVWSVGTINWGTAVRHHLPSIGLLVVAAFSYSNNKDRFLINGRLQKRHIA